jgi:hypothetical protein
MTELKLDLEISVVLEQDADPQIIDHLTRQLREDRS